MKSSSIQCPSCKSFFNIDRYIKGCCPNCGVKNPVLVVPQKDQCGNCHSIIKQGDVYCRYCGTRIGEKFVPYLNINDCVYGPPPVETEHKCWYCGNIWNSFSNSFGESKNYCPKCGKVIVTIKLVDYISLGEYDELSPGKGYSSIRDFLMKETYPGQGKIIYYLLHGNVDFISSCSSSKDVFTGQAISNEIVFMNDGEYRWNNTLVYYVKKYNLKLPREFERKVLSTSIKSL